MKTLPTRLLLVALLAFVFLATHLWLDAETESATNPPGEGPPGSNTGNEDCECPPCTSSDPAAAASPQAAMPAGSMGASSGGGGQGSSRSGAGLQNHGPESIPWKGGSSYTSGNGNFEVPRPIPGISGGKSTGSPSPSLSYGPQTLGPESLAKRGGTLPGLTTGTGIIRMPTLQLAVDIKRPSPMAFTPTTGQVQIGRGAGWTVPGKVQMSFDSNNNFTAKIPNNSGNFEINAGSGKTLSGANYKLQGGFENATGMRINADQVVGGGSIDGDKYFVLNRNDGTKARYDTATGKLADFTTAQGKRVSMGSGKGEIIESAGELRQVKSAEGLMNIRMLPGKDQGYVSEYYDTSQVTGKGSGGVYAFVGVPKRSMTVENPNWESGNTNSVKITGTEGGRTITNTYTYGESNKEWTNLRGDGSRVVERESEQAMQPVNISTKFDVINGKLVAPVGTPAGSAKIMEKTSELFDASNNLVSRTKTIYWIPNDNSEQKLAEIKDEGGLNHTTRWTYYTNTADPARYARVKSELHPDGSWKTYAYDDAGRIVTETRPWQDTPYSENPGTVGTRQTSYDYAPVITGDILQENDGRPRTKAEYINGIEVGRTYYGYPKNAVGEILEIVERAATQGASYGTTGNQRTTTTYYAESAGEASAGEVKSIETSDGLLTSFTYEIDESATGNTDAYLTTAKTEGTTASPAGVSGKTLRRVIKQNKAGQTFSEETQVYFGGSYTRLNLFESRYNISGKLIQSLKDGRVTYDAVWQDDLLMSETDEAGITTEYTYDAIKELKTATKKGIGGQPDIVTTYNRTVGGLDCGCNGNVETIVTAGGLRQRAMTKKDKIGRLIEETTTAGLTTTYAYTNDGRTVTALLPNTGVIVRTQHLDRNSESEFGTGTIATHYTYGINLDGTRWTKATKVSSDGPRWKKSEYDFLGRLIRQESPGFNDSIIVAENQYNAQGYLIETTEYVTGGTAGANPKTFINSYDSIGNLISIIARCEGLADQTKIKEEDYQLINGGVNFVSKKQLKYTDDLGADRVITQEIVRVRRNNFSSSLSPGIPGGSIIEYIETLKPPFNAEGETVNVLRSAAALDRSSKSAYFAKQDPADSRLAVVSRTNGIIQSEISPIQGGTILYNNDALGRITGIKTPRAENYSVTSYNSFGQIFSATDAVGNATEFIYYENGMPGAGKLRQQINAQGKSVFYQYDLLHREILRWGNGIAPVAQGYDFYGQRILVRTYRSILGGVMPSNSNSDTSSWIYDEPTGLLLRQTDAKGKSINYEYYADGINKKNTLPSVTNDGQPISITFSHNRRGAVTGIIYSDGTPNVALERDALGSIKRSIQGEGASQRVTSYAYDNQTRAQVSETIQEGTAQQTLYHGFDVYRRPRGHVLVVDGTVVSAARYDYDSFGRYSAVRVGTAPDELASVGDTSNLTKKDYNYTRLQNSNLISSVQSDALKTSYDYEPNRDVKTSVKNQSGDGQALFSKFEYEYDMLARQTKATVNIPAQHGEPEISNLQTYSYNDRSELIQQSAYSDLNTSGEPEAEIEQGRRRYNYDSIGNRLSYGQGSSSEEQYIFNELNQRVARIAEDDREIPITYDDNGNLLANGEGSSYKWDAENRLIMVQKDGMTVYFRYDASGRRIEKRVVTAQKTEIIRFTYDRWRLIFEEKKTVEGTTSETILYGWGLSIANSVGSAGNIGGLLSRELYRSGLRTLSCMLYDGRGNVTGSLAENGAVVSCTYDAFGVPDQNTDIGAFGFSTKYTDKETGLVYFGYRYYKPTSGTWLNRDPKGIAGGLNLMAFVLNNPLAFVDALGLEPGAQGGTSGQIGINCPLGNIHIDWPYNGLVFDPTKKSEDPFAYLKLTENGDWWDASVMGSTNGELLAQFGISSDPFSGEYSAQWSNDGWTHAVSGTYQYGNLSITGSGTYNPDGSFSWNATGTVSIDPISISASGDGNSWQAGVSAQISGSTSISLNGGQNAQSSWWGGGSISSNLGGNATISAGVSYGQNPNWGGWGGSGTSQGGVTVGVGITFSH